MIRLPFILSALLLLALGACNKAEPQLATAMTIERIELTEYPMTRSDGSSWDPTYHQHDAEPEIVVSLLEGSSPVSTEHLYQSDPLKANPAHPTMSYTDGLPFTLTDFTTVYTLALHEWDNSGLDDVMGCVTFDVTTYSADQPNQFQLVSTDQSVQATLFVDWQE